MKRSLHLTDNAKLVTSLVTNPVRFVELTGRVNVTKVVPFSRRTACMTHHRLNQLQGHSSQAPTSNKAGAKVFGGSSFTTCLNFDSGSFSDVADEAAHRTDARLGS
ncbi:MAG: hypothetical protein AAGG48_28270 [Planctomycetota bacterium]